MLKLSTGGVRTGGYFRVFKMPRHLLILTDLSPSFQPYGNDYFFLMVEFCNHSAASDVKSSFDNTIVSQ